MTEYNELLETLETLLKEMADAYRARWTGLITETEMVDRLAEATHAAWFKISPEREPHDGN